jgi:hypothetical protein
MGEWRQSSAQLFVNCTQNRRVNAGRPEAVKLQATGWTTMKRNKEEGRKEGRKERKKERKKDRKKGDEDTDAQW